jgi:midasin
VLFDRELGIVNCHASTETSDLLGGLRPLRGRKIIMKNMVEKMRIVVSNIEDKDAFASISIPNYLKGDSEKAPDNASAAIACLSKEVRSAGLKCASNVHTNSNENVKPARFEKRRKLENGGAKEISNGDVDISRLTELLDEVDVLAQHHASLFEWVDGPLVGAMRKGHLFLLDEMSLAEDAVLERLNSVLEPSRTLVLAEKGGDLSLDEDSDESTEVKAHDDFRVFATMNPGGDFGKRELSPALRSRFTEIWVPSVTESSDIELVLGQTLQASLQKYHVQHISESCLVNIKQNMLNYVIWFNNDICSKPMSTFTDFVLSLRDVLAWARFVMETSCNNKELSIWSAYAHGASLMHLDGLGLGTGLSHEEASETKATAKTFLHNAIPDNEERVAGFEDEYECIDDNALYINGNFGVHPFMIPTGEVEIPNKLGFKLSAPTTGMNLRRVLRAMQISKPILLEGSPGVGKTRYVRDSVHIVFVRLS